jgi:hypothetical protein
MSEILSIDVDWVDDLDEPSGLIWIRDGWSLSDRRVGSAAQSSYGVCGFGCQGSSTRQNEFELQHFFNIDEVGPVASFAQRSRPGHSIETVAS